MKKIGVISAIDMNMNVSAIESFTTITITITITIAITIMIVIAILVATLMKIIRIIELMLGIGGFYLGWAWLCRFRSIYITICRSSSSYCLC